MAAHTSTKFLDKMFSLKGRVALVTGASSGIGQRMATALARAGSDVVLLARRGDLLRETATQLTEEFRVRTHCIEADLITQKDFDEIARQASAPFGACDILVNGAGVNYREPWNEISRETWDNTVILNLTAPYFLSQAIVPGMMEKGLGNIINIASLQVYRAFPNSIPYGASKAGVAQMTRAMAECWSPGGQILVNAIAPGYFPTDLTAPVYGNPKLLAHHTAMTAMGRTGNMEDLDGITVFLASRAAGYITGQVLPVDGGYTAK